MRTTPLDKSGETVGVLFSLMPPMKNVGQASEYERVARNCEHDEEPASPTGEEAVAGPAAQESASSSEASPNPEGEARQAPTEETPATKTGANASPETGKPDVEAKPADATARPHAPAPADQTKTARTPQSAFQATTPVEAAAKPVETRPVEPRPSPSPSNGPEPSMPNSPPRHRLASTPAEPVARLATREAPVTATASRVAAHFVKPEVSQRLVSELQGRVSAIEILARRHGEAVARLNVQSPATGLDAASLISSPVNEEPRLSKTAQRHLAAKERAQAEPFETPNRVPTPPDPRAARAAVLTAPPTRETESKSHINVPQTSLAATAPKVATATAAPQPVTPSHVDLSERIERFQAVTQRLAARVAGIVTNGGGAAVIRLQPEFLGKMRVEVRVEQAAAGVQIVTDNPQVTRLLQTEQWWLKDALAQNGITLGHFDVRGGDPGAAFGFEERRAASDHASGGRPQKTEEAATPTRSRPSWHDGRVSVMA